METLSETAKAILDLYRTIELRDRESKTKCTLLKKEIKENLGISYDFQKGIDELEKAVFITGNLTPNEPETMEYQLTSLGRPYVFPDKYPNDWRKIRDSGLKRVQVAIVTVLESHRGDMLSVRQVIDDVLKEDDVPQEPNGFSEALILCGIDYLHRQRRDKILIITNDARPGKDGNLDTLKCFIIIEEAKKFINKYA